ncbi:MAG TPA: hypothetical protein VNV42_16880 [Solirubrobacteraceae bacterium]|jgi:hypothetical protein|nr:hypothetical protein [Solirubrobacteraceae bacterium]
MSSQPHREARGRLRGAPERLHVRRRALAATSATLIAALVALPTTAALAGADTSLPGGAGSAERPALPQLVAPGELLSAGQLEQLLATLPLADLSAAQLAHHLAALEGVSALAGLKLGLLSQLGVTGLEESLREAIEQLGAGAKLGELAGSEGVANLLPKLEAALESKLGGLGLLETLLGKLPGGGLSGVEGALGSLSLTQLVGSLLSTAHGEETPLKEELLAKLATLANGLFGELGSEGKLESLLGGLQPGKFTPESVKEVSEQLKTTPKVVSEELGLGKPGEQLEEGTTMLTAPLANGKLVGVAPAVNAAKGLVTGVLGNLAEEPGGEGKEEGEEGGKNPGGGSGEEKGSGENKNEGGKGSGSAEGKGGSGSGSGGPGGSGSGGTGGSTTVVLTLPANATTQGAASKQASGSVSVVAHRVHGRVATIVLRVPSAGAASISGKGVHGVSKQAAKAERLTLRVPLTTAAAASLRHHHRHHLAVRLTAAFHPSSGSNSSTTVTVVFT